MAAVTISEAIAIETRAQANGWTAEQLLDLAGERLGHAIARFFPESGMIVGYLGKGHNAGDALVALRVLRDHHGWKIATRNAFPINGFSPLTLRKWDELGLRAPLDRRPAWRDWDRPLVLLDGLLGTGSSGHLREPLLTFATEMASLRQTGGAKVAAVDLPSGIDPDSGEIFHDSVVADITFMIGNAKRGLLGANAANATGALALVAVEPLTATGPSDRQLISPQTTDFGKAPRPFDFHKGIAGRVVIVAGSEAYTGAPVLAATGALRGGAGLVTLFVPNSIRSIVASTCPPEVILCGYNDHLSQVLESRFDSLVVGCGLGKPTASVASGILDMISRSSSPVVIDADALNLIAESGRLDLLTEKHLITPHPGEFARLAPDLSDCPREEAARRFTNRVPATLLLKGCRTLVTRKGELLWCNSTGTPAMATGGQGDLLSGVIGARLASGDSPLEAAMIGAWVCGRAAEIAVNSGLHSEESLLPTDVLKLLGEAFRDWKNSAR